eukprot:1792359-Rhodomonas_salina.1
MDVHARAAQNPDVCCGATRLCPSQSSRRWSSVATAWYGMRLVRLRIPSAISETDIGVRARPGGFQRRIRGVGRAA